MIYNITKTISNAISDEEFVATCEREYKRVLHIYFFLYCLVTCLYIPVLPMVIEPAPKILYLFLVGLWTIAGVGCYPKFDSQKYSMKDWILIANNYTRIPNGSILRKYFELNSLEPIEAMLLSHEIRCRNNDTNEIVVLNLNNTKFKDIFKIIKKEELETGQMILDLSQDILTAYIK